MTHYTISYKEMPDGPLKDEAAINDIKEYLSKKQWAALMDVVKHGEKCRALDIYLRFMGVQGFPVFAFLRRYAPDTYQAWYDTLED